MAVSALCDISKSEVVRGKISKLNGAVLILGKVAGSKAENPTVAEKAEMTLQNLGRCEKNAVQMARKNFSARIFRENRKSCFSAGSGFFTYRPKFSALLNIRPNQIGAAKYQATPLPPNTKSYSYSIPHLSRSLHDFIGSHDDSGGHIKQTVCCGKKVIFICIVVSCLYY